MDTSALTLLASSLGLTATSGLLSWLTARFSQRRSASVEKEVVEALGLDENAGHGVPVPDGGLTAGEIDENLRRLLREMELETGQRIEVNIQNNTASGALSEIAKRDSDGNARLVAKYYAQGHQQAFITFVASVTFAVVGFLVILAAAVFMLMNPQQPEPAGVIGGVGLVNQGVAFLFFRRADNARNLMLRLIDKLREDREKEIRFIAGVVASDAIVSPSLRDAVRAATAIESFGSAFTPEQLRLVSEVANVGQPVAPLVSINPPVPDTNGGRPTAADTSASGPSPHGTPTGTGLQPAGQPA